MADHIDIKKLIKMAFKVRENAYCPYSGFSVGAALECADGTVYTGCNVENAAYGPSNCAERTAVFKAVSERKLNFKRIAIVGGAVGESVAPTPCGVCRQVLSEFCEPSFEIIMASSEAEYEVMTLAELLPRSFDLD